MKKSIISSCLVLTSMIPSVAYARLPGPLEVFGVGLIIAIFTLQFLPAIIAAIIASSKGRSGIGGFLLGSFLSWIGVIIAACMTNYNLFKSNVNVEVKGNTYTPEATEAPKEIQQIHPELITHTQTETSIDLDEEIALLEKKKKVLEEQREEERKRLTEEEKIRLENEEQDRLRKEAEERQKEQELAAKREKLAKIEKMKKELKELEEESQATG